MAELIIRTEHIQDNIRKLGTYFKERNIQWSLISKVFSGDTDFIAKVFTPEAIPYVDSIGDSRLTSLKNLRAVNPDMRTIYIKPPAKVYADDVVRYANISLNSSFETIEALNIAAEKQGKDHQVIIMLEMGELREGVLREGILEFYERIFNMPNIDVIGIGSNLGCMYGIEPTRDKLLQLALYKELISAKFDRDVPLVSGGTSITLPLIDSGVVPPEINHFRVGEAAFFGVSPLRDEQFLDLSTDAFEFSANIIELEEKEIVPDGVISEANIGHTAEFNEEKDQGEKSYKAILDFGLLDVDQENLIDNSKSMEFVGITSDMTVVDVGNNKTKDGKTRFQVGDSVLLKPNYMATARLLMSKFIDRKFE